MKIDLIACPEGTRLPRTAGQRRAKRASAKAEAVSDRSSSGFHGGQNLSYTPPIIAYSGASSQPARIYQLHPFGNRAGAYAQPFHVKIQIILAGRLRQGSGRA
ncbi:hypothetical protein [Rhodobacter sp. 24-YEA-8]|uniref:hypothetical protein n=1 Tax=Rhodobacter sp. 24-YEA-8 TaxID=1884310 RepID=UPI000B83F399|nr:hypothetical protein [Rhodobacter sp. 24-YEA-8]